MRYQEIELVPSAARTTNGSGSVIPTLGSRDNDLPDLTVALDVTAASASDTLDVVVKGFFNGVAVTVATFTQATAVSQEVIHISGCPDSVRVDWTIGGTAPSFTFSVQSVRS